MIVVLSEMLLDVVPDVSQVDEVEEEGQLLFSVVDPVLDGVGVGAVVGLLISWFEVADEGV